MWSVFYKKFIVVPAQVDGRTQKLNYSMDDQETMTYQSESSLSYIHLFYI